MDVKQQLCELISFLRDRNPQVRALALQNLVPHTIKGTPHRDLLFAGLHDIKVLCRDQLNTAHDAFRALVNLSDDPLAISALSELSFLSFLAAYVINPHAILADLASMLLSNLTVSTPACKILLSLQLTVVPDSRLSNHIFPVDSRSASCPPPIPYPSGKEIKVQALPLLVDAFVQGATVGDIKDPSKRMRKGELHFLAHVFANLTVSPIGRNFFLSPQPTNVLNPSQNLAFPLSHLVVFTEHSDHTRRAGVASCIKNCAFLATGHKAILSPDTERVSVSPKELLAPGIDALPYLLLPLAGPEEFDLEDQEKLLEPLQFLPPTKTRDKDPSIRLTLIETLLLLCHTRWGRDYLRSHGVYEIVRTADENERVKNISDHIERLVQLLKGDEPSQPLLEGQDISTLQVDDSDSGQGSERAYFTPVSNIGNILAQGQCRLDDGGGKKEGEKREHEDHDDEDDRIEEL